MNFVTAEGLTYDDVLLVPQYSTLDSRSDADTSTLIGNIKLKVPIISANMDTVTGFDMAKAMGFAGGAGILHRYQEIDQVVDSLKKLKTLGLPAIPSVGVKGYDIQAAHEYRKYTETICLDIAHGDSAAGVKMVMRLYDLGYSTIIAGNVATYDGAAALNEAGANVIKVGIGPGSVCTTRLVTGHGVPQLTAVDYANHGGRRNYHVIADGGLKNSGDIVKALAAGADAVMTGSLFAGVAEAPNRGIYRGMASTEAQKSYFGVVHNSAPEGVSQTIVPKQVNAGDVIEQLAGGIRSGMSYSGASTLKELRENALFIRVSSNTVVENGPRNLK